MKASRRWGVGVVAVVFVVALPALADVFNMPSGLTSLETVTVGNPGNPGNAWYNYLWPKGGVGYTYQIGKFEITAGQYCEFLNAVAASDTYGLYNAAMLSDRYGCKIQQNGSAGAHTYSVPDANYVNRPVNFVSWADAARFCNWLHNGQPTGGQTLSTTEDGSYYLNGVAPDGLLWGVERKEGATWVIPSEDEWYKAAYHKNDGVTGNYWEYPMRNSPPPEMGGHPGRDISEANNPGWNANWYSGDPFLYFPYPMDSNTILRPIDSGTYYTTVVGQFYLSDSPYGTFDQAGNVYEWTDTQLISTPDRCTKAGHLIWTVCSW